MKSTVRCRQPALPPLSSRTLLHPSFMPLYLAVNHHRTDCNNQPVPPIIPAECFYSDPSMSRGRRIPNMVSDLRFLNCFQLNTSPPVMSACLAPPASPDPFRSGPHPIVDLGNLSFTISTLHPPVQLSRAVIQLTQEEDQAITHLLKLQHQEPTPLTSAEEVYKPICSDAQHFSEAGLQGRSQRGRCWSDTEREAAETLLSGFSLVEKDQSWGENYSESADTLPDHLQQQRSLPSSITDSTQKVISCSHVRESGEPGWGDVGFVEGSNAEGSNSERSNVEGSHAEGYFASSLPQKSRSSVLGVKKRTLSDSEGDAVHVLLSLGDVTA